MQSVSYVQVNGVQSSNLFHLVALVRIDFTTFCSQIRSQDSKRQRADDMRRARNGDWTLVARSCIIRTFRKLFRFVRRGWYGER
jgi:hypothetical protein